MYLRNAWYVAARSADVARRLRAYTLLGENVVLYRTRGGTVAGLEDACPHRKMPLSMGTLADDNVRCGYHGLTFDPSGSCVAAPTQNRIPMQARVRSYPLCERYGLIWIWMGDPALADESKIVSIEDYDSEDWGLTEGGELACHCHYLYLLDNLLDPSHVAWVHASTFASSGTEDTPLVIDDDEQGVLVSRWIRDVEPPPYYSPRLKFNGRVDRLQYYRALYPSISVNISIFTPAGSGGDMRNLPPTAYCMRSYHFLTPVDEERTRYFWLQHFNTDIGDEAVRKALDDGARRAFEEDKVVLEAVHAGMRDSSTPNIDLRLDEGARRFRRALTKSIEREQAAG